MVINTIHWFRKGLRLHDNPSLKDSLLGADSVRCVYILDPWFAGSSNVGINRWRWANADPSLSFWMHFKWKCLQNVFFSCSVLSHKQRFLFSDHIHSASWGVLPEFCLCMMANSWMFDFWSHQQGKEMFWETFVMIWSLSCHAVNFLTDLSSFSRLNHT